MRKRSFLISLCSWSKRAAVGTDMIIIQLVKIILSGRRSWADFFARATLCSERGREEGVKKKFIFTLFLLSLVALWLHRVLFSRVRESNLGELACSKLLEGQICGEKPVTLFTKTATVENHYWNVPLYCTFSFNRKDSTANEAAQILVSTLLSGTPQCLYIL